VLWFAVQLGALLLSLLRVSFAAAYPRAGELLAAHVMVVSQVVAAALLFPYLMRTWPAAVAVVASSWPFDAVAGVFSAAPAGHVVWAAAYVTAWLLVLAIWNRALPEQRGIAMAAAALAAIGGCAVFYLRLEFAAGDIDAADVWAVAPAVPPLAALRPLVRSTEPIDWTLPAAAGFLELAAWHTRRRRHLLPRSGQVIHKS
jgi:hypothetical protein